MKIQSIGLLLAFILQQSAISIPQQATPKGSIEGTVVRIGTGEPISGVRVTLQTTSGPGRGQERTVVSTESGEFVITDLDPGVHRIGVTANVGQRLATEPGSSVVFLAAGQMSKRVHLELMPAGSVSGRIRDSEGRTLVGLEVQLLWTTYEWGGRRSFHSAGSKMTDERGEYRFLSVTEGRYYLIAGSATGQLLSASPVVGDSPNGAQEQERYALTYYPGVLDLPDANVVEVQPGQNLAAFDFTVYAEETYKLRGRVIDSRTGQEPEAVTLWIQSETFTGEPITSPINMGTNGEFEFRNLVPGSYTVEARILDKNQPDSPSRVSTSAPITISNSDTDDVMVVVFPPASIPGRLTIDGQEVSSFRGLEHIRVLLAGGVSSRQSQTVNPDGTFRIDSVMPGQYQVIACLGGPNSSACARSTPDFYLKYAQFDGQEVLNTPLQFLGTVGTALDIVLSPRPGRIQGTLLNEEDAPVAGVQAVLIPDHNRDRFDLYEFATSDPGGQFTIRGITPGVYKVFAWEALEENAYFDSDVM